MTFVNNGSGNVRKFGGSLIFDVGFFDVPGAGGIDAVQELTSAATPAGGENQSFAVNG